MKSLSYINRFLTFIVIMAIIIGTAYFAIKAKQSDLNKPFSFNGEIKSQNISVNSIVNGNITKVYFNKGSIIKKGDKIIDIAYVLPYNQNVYYVQQNISTTQTPQISNPKTPLKSSNTSVTSTSTPILTPTNIDISNTNPDVKGITFSKTLDNFYTLTESNLALYAPVSGQIINMNYSIGDSIKVNDSAFSIIQDDSLYLKALVPYDQINDISLPNTNITWSLKDSDVKYSASIKYIYPNIQDNKRQVEFSIDKPSIQILTDEPVIIYAQKYRQDLSIFGIKLSFIK